ncbi:MAG TPA: 50S ribosomal protein L11 methyltransferase [Pseudogracilibacillus sp.]|nr:50S ribosomal protein L11 methyltransferase [Pseudogracilibacillus sp.]
MKWNEILIHTNQAAEELITHILNENGSNGVIIEDPLDLEAERPTRFGEIYDIDTSKYPKEGIYLKGYLIDNEEFDEKLATIKKEINELAQFQIPVEEITYTISSVDEEDWSTSWKKYYKPTKISDKFLVVPNWEEDYTLGEDELKLVLDPGMAFGTGTHPTTILSVRGLEQVVQKDDEVIDVGCGSGVLSIAAVLLGAKSVAAYDLDEVAVNSTNINKAFNNIDTEIIAKQNNLLKGVTKQADVIVANILAEIIVDLIDDAQAIIKPNGYLVLSGIIDKKADLVKNKLEQHNFKIIKEEIMEHWVMLIAQAI